MIWRILAALCLLFAAFEMPAEAQQRKAALVIGNGAYRHAPALPNPPNDARAVADALRKLGFDVTLALDVDQRGMREALHGFASGSTEAGDPIATFYFAGHALGLAGENYLVPVDAAIRDEVGVRMRAVDLTSVFDVLDRVSGGKIVILDANRDNPFVRPSSDRRARAPVAGRGLARPSPHRRRSVVLMASAPGTVAPDGSGANSPFTPRS